MARPGQRRPEGDDWNTLVARYKGGADDRAIAKELGVSAVTVRSWMHDAGVYRDKAPGLKVQGDTIKDCSFEEVLDALTMASKLQCQAIPPFETAIRVDAEAPVVIVWTADWHLGAAGVDYPTFRADVERWVSSAGCLVYCGGDQLDNFVGRIVDHSSSAIPMQREAYRAVIAKLRGKILAMGTGNHDLWSQAAAGIDTAGDMARQCKIIYTGSAGAIKLRLGKQVYHIYRSHKMAGNSYLNDAHSMMRYCREHGRQPYRVIIREHVHRAVCREWDYDGHQIWLVGAGTYKTQDEYARGLGHSPGIAYSPGLVFWPDRDRIAGFRDYREALEFRDALLR